MNHIQTLTVTKAEVHCFFSNSYKRKETVCESVWRHTSQQQKTKGMVQLLFQSLICRRFDFVFVCCCLVSLCVCHIFLICLLNLYLFILLSHRAPQLQPPLSVFTFPTPFLPISLTSLPSPLPPNFKSHPSYLQDTRHVSQQASPRCDRQAHYAK